MMNEGDDEEDDEEVEDDDDRWRRGRRRRRWWRWQDVKIKNTIAEKMIAKLRKANWMEEWKHGEKNWNWFLLNEFLRNE